jgi:hypothetical protein
MEIIVDVNCLYVVVNGCAMMMLCPDDCYGVLSSNR